MFRFHPYHSSTLVISKVIKIILPTPVHSAYSTSWSFCFCFCFNLGQPPFPFFSSFWDQAHRLALYLAWLGTLCPSPVGSPLPAASSSCLELRSLISSLLTLISYSFPRWFHPALRPLIRVPKNWLNFLLEYQISMKQHGPQTLGLAIKSVPLQAILIISESTATYSTAQERILAILDFSSSDTLHF